MDLIKNLYLQLFYVPAEYYLHILVSQIIFEFVFEILKIKSFNKKLIVSTLIVLFIGICKEIFDMLSYGLFDWYDLLSDIIGILIAILIILYKNRKNAKQ
jgi:uncharacterized protein involved in cysteine biosynthesis